MSNTITFQRDGSNEWERAYTEEHLKLKLGNDKAVVIRPKKSFFHRISILRRFLKRYY